MTKHATTALVALSLLVLAMPLAAQTPPPANSVACLPTGQELAPIPAVHSAGGFLRATLRTTAEQVNLPSGSFGTSPAICYPQWVREYRLDPAPPPSNTVLANPTPGPILWAKVGDLVELTFLNEIDPNKFPNSDTGCDKTSIYPQAVNPDKYPDCFALSTTTNVHYHGTHTNPNSTGDNVFLEIKPSPRSNDAARTPVVTSDLVKDPFKTFFDKCEVELAVNNAPIEWPRFWDDLPQSLKDLEKGLLEKYRPDLWAKNDTAIKQGAWPQYYLGNYPYCFRLPKYTSSTFPPASPAVTTSAHTGGAGSIEHDEAAQPTRPLMMGQAPGTHWYHAHKHGSTTINVSNGMTGVFVIQDDSPTGYDGFIANAYKAYPNFKQQVLVVNQLGTSPKLERGGPGGPGPHFAVNGRLQPKITMTGGEVQLWRIANNASRGGVFVMAPAANGLSWKQTAQDGVQYADSNYKNDLNQPMLLAAGNRADLLVKAPMLPPGQKTATYSLVVENSVDPSDRAPAKPNAPLETLLTVQVNANGPDMPFMATAPPLPDFLTDVTDDEVKGKTKRLVFASSAPGTADQHTIDGKLFDGEVGASVLLNEAEEWTIVNETYVPNQIAHPFHIHINPFQIVDVFDPSDALSSAKGAGTVTTTAKGNVVTGTGTSFTTSVHVGDFIWINGEKPATVLSIQSDTALTFNIAAKGVTGATYTIAVPLYSVDKTVARAGQCVITPGDETTYKNCHAPAKPEHHIWWDVFSIPSGNTFTNAAGATFKIPGHFKMRSRFVDYAGFFVLHCHILSHEDRGMMTIVEVTPLQPPYSHH